MPIDSPSAAWYGVAALGALGLAAPDADAQILFTDIDDVTITNGDSLRVDFDGDGDPELSLDSSLDSVGSALAGFSDAAEGEPDRVIAIAGNTTGGYQYFLPLSAGATISEGNIAGTSTFQFGPSFTFRGADPNGWIGSGDKYVGVQIEIDTDGELTEHFAWVLVEVPAQNTMIIKSFAVQTEPGVEILAGDGMTTASEPDALEEGYLFSAIAPNPVAGRATFDLAVGEAETVSVDLYDTVGRRVKTVFSGALIAGDTKTIEVLTGELPAGVYVVRVSGDSFVTTRTVTVVR